MNLHNSLNVHTRIHVYICTVYCTLRTRAYNVVTYLKKCLFKFDHVDLHKSQQFNSLMDIAS